VILETTSPSDGGGALPLMTATAAVCAAASGSENQPFGPRSRCSRTEAHACSFGDHGSQGVVRRGGLQHHLTADGEPHAADPAAHHLGSPAEPGNRRVDVRRTLPAEEVRRILGSDPFIRRTGRTITNIEHLVQNLAEASARGYAVDDGEDELLDIFLEEAREVVGNGLAAVQALAANPADVSELTTLRRAFHTLKGSSRMVGLNEFGEAGWSLEQVLNT